MPYRVLKRRLNKTGEKSFKTYDFDKHYEGVRYRKRVTLLPSAVQKVYHDWVSSIYQGSYQKESKITLGEVVQKYYSFCEQNKSPREKVKIKLYLTPFTHFFNKKNISKINNNDLDLFCNELSSKYPNPNTYNRALNVLSAFFNYCDKREYRLSSKLLHGRKKKVTKREMVLLNEEQIRSLLGSCREEYQRTFIMLAIFTGMRHSEILSLKWSDVISSKGMIRLRAETTKAKKTRIIPLVKMLREYLATVTKKSEYVVSYLGRRLMTFRKSWQHIMARCSFKFKLRIHDLRHHFITMLVNSGTPLRQIQEIVGHSNLVMTERYSNLNQDYLSGVAKKIGNNIADILSMDKK